MHWMADTRHRAQLRWMIPGLLALLCGGALAATEPAPLPEPTPGPIPSAPSISARAYILEDYQSGHAIAEANADERMDPASLTKMMTAYVISRELAAGHVKLDAELRVSEKAWRTGGSRMFVEVGNSVKVEDLLRGVIVQSGNDACVTLAEGIAGSEDAFAQMMNHEAQRLGMTNTHFMNSTGLPDPEHYTTARDLATLSRALIRDFPEHYAWYSERDFSYNNITQHNRNTLLWWDQSVDGIKTGHTESAGYCLAASAQKEGMRLITVVLGASGEKSRATESQKLLTYGFRFYETHKLYSADDVLSEPRIWGGDSSTIPLGVDEDYYVTIPRGQYKRLNASLNMDSSIEAPAEKGQAFGSVVVKLGDEDLDKRPLVALAAVAEGGMFRRAFDWVQRQVSQLFD